MEEAAVRFELVDINEILKTLPHRYPMLLIDRVIKIRTDYSGIGIKNVTFNEPPFLGHFPERPVYPGVMMIEAMAQTAGVIGIKSVEGTEKPRAVYFLTIDKCKFRKPVMPGDTIEYTVNLVNSGTAAAEEVVFADAIPEHTSYVPGSMTMNGAVLTNRRPFTILGDLRIVERRQDGAVNSSLGYFRFDDRILSNLQLNYTKPVCIEEFFKLKSEIAQLVYTHIDLMLFDKTKYERRTRDLFEDLGLKNSEYTHMYERRRALERALKELEGIRLSSGTLQSAIIEKTKDRKDYKVGFHKGARVDLVAEQVESTTAQSHPDPVVINHYYVCQNRPARVRHYIGVGDLIPYDDRPPIGALHEP